MSFNINVKSHLWLMQAAKKHLDESEGVFITTASAAGMTPSGSSLAYSVTKAAQIHLVKNLAVMAAPRIRVNSVSPGLLLTVSFLSLSLSLSFVSSVILFPPTSLSLRGRLEVFNV